MFTFIRQSLRSASLLSVRFHTWWVVTKLRLLGQKIKIGRGTFIARTARLNPTGGVIIIGQDCFIGEGAIVRANQGVVCLSDKASIGEYCLLHGQGKIFLGRNALLAPQVSLVPGAHNIALGTPIRKQGHRRGRIFVGAESWLGTGVKVMPNVRIGRGSVVGAGAVVTKDTVANGIYVGVPAALVGHRK